MAGGIKPSAYRSKVTGKIGTPGGHTERSLDQIVPVLVSILDMMTVIAASTDRFDASHERIKRAREVVEGRHR